MMVVWLSLRLLHLLLLYDPWCMSLATAELLSRDKPGALEEQRHAVRHCMPRGAGHVLVEAGWLATVFKLGARLFAFCRMVRLVLSIAAFAVATDRFLHAIAVVEQPFWMPCGGCWMHLMGG